MDTNTKFGNGPLRRRTPWQGFSLIELLIVVAIILIITAIAIPNLLKARIAANEASAAESVRMIVTAGVVYNSTWSNGYPPDLLTLGGVGPISTCNQAALIDPVIAQAPFQKAGYQYAYAPVGAPVGAAAPTCGAPGYYQFLVTAAPLNIGGTGERAFCSDQPGVIHVAQNGVPPASVGACEALPTL
jgi:prepilin-type N-terminal cleavage/methylation domain-containing protein